MKDRKRLVNLFSTLLVFSIVSTLFLYGESIETGQAIGMNLSNSDENSILPGTGHVAALILNILEALVL